MKKVKGPKILYTAAYRTRKPCYRRENRAMSISIRIEFYNRP